MERAHQPKRHIQRDLLVGLAVNQANRTIERDITIEQTQLLPRFPEAAGNALPSGRIAAPETPIGKVRRSRDADERKHPVAALKRDVEGDPAAHRRTHEDQWT